ARLESDHLRRTRKENLATLAQAARSDCLLPDRASGASCVTHLLRDGSWRPVCDLVAGPGFDPSRPDVRALPSRLYVLSPGFAIDAVVPASESDRRRDPRTRHPHVLDRKCNLARHYLSEVRNRRPARNYAKSGQ